MKKVRTRFAPSPTGYMHLGNLRSALYGFLFARQNNGEYILRIEDTDLDRYVPGAVEVIYDTLERSGIYFDEGPNEGGPYGPYVQSLRKEIYLKYAKELVDKGAAYYCFCTKERLESLADETGVKKYDKHCLKLSKEEIEEKLRSGIPYVIRQNMPTTGVSKYTDLVYGEIVIENKELEDQVLIKSDGFPTYNFANVIDDHLMHVTHVMRGNEYLSSTPKYNLLYDAFGWEKPQYIHLPPIMKDETRKLSKRHGDAYFDDFVKKGFLPEAIVNYIALLGWSPKTNQEKFTMEELIQQFDIKGISRSGAIFDINKLCWLNSEYIKELDFDKFMVYATPYFEQSSIKNRYDYRKFGKILQTRIETFADVIEKVKFIDEYQQFDPILYENKKLKIDIPLAKDILSRSIPILEELDDNMWYAEKMHEVIVKIAERFGYKAAQVYTVLRVALSGLSVTPGGSAEIADILGKNESIRRLKQSLAWLD